jgi:hypothetical protein
MRRRAGVNVVVEVDHEPTPYNERPRGRVWLVPMRTEHQYDRGGSLQYLAAWDVNRAKVFGPCAEKTGIEPCGRFSMTAFNSAIQGSPSDPLGHVRTANLFPTLRV